MYSKGMALKIYNTLKGRKEEFVPITPGKAGMYVCGVTVYDLCHLGHARGAVVFDVVSSYLRYAGYEVKYVKNFTDIDDKIIARAKEENVDSAALAERFIVAYNKDMEALGVRPADSEPRATEHMDDIISLVDRLVERDVAYSVDGDVYFRVRSFPSYGALSGRSTDDMVAGARIEVDERKEDPLDFALWKSSKPGEPWWESPWGKGRPGWHIECSAMSASHLGEEFDIHGGGKDLIFPHHENEIAQSQAFSGRTFVRYWMHNGFVNINREKMSKSLGNFFTIRDILEKYDAEAIRFFLLSTHYRSPIDFSNQNLEEATKTLDRFYHLIGDLEESLSAGADGEEGGGGEAAEAVATLKARFRSAMDDDFNTAEALGEIFKTSRVLSVLLSRGENVGRERVGKFLEALRETGGVLGVLNGTPENWKRRRLRREEQEKTAIDGAWVESRIAERERARGEKDWAAADAIRDELLKRGVTLEDTAEGTAWHLEKE
jgi:cysteinyl-tRNA synthetase